MYRLADMERLMPGVESKFKEVAESLDLDKLGEEGKSLLARAIDDILSAFRNLKITIQVASGLEDYDSRRIAMLYQKLERSDALILRAYNETLGYRG